MGPLQRSHMRSSACEQHAARLGSRLWLQRLAGVGGILPRASVTPSGSHRRRSRACSACSTPLHACAPATDLQMSHTEPGTRTKPTSIASSASWSAVRPQSSHLFKTRPPLPDNLPAMKLYPSLRYKDAKAAHQWLQEAFGFEPVALY